MTFIIGVVSQKGGVGKSTLSRLVAREYAAARWSVKIADLDISQGTSFNWQSRRLARGILPEIAVERFGTVEQALKVATGFCHTDVKIHEPARIRLDERPNEVFFGSPPDCRHGAEPRIWRSAWLAPQ